MAFLYITEYAEVHLGLGGRQGQMPIEPPVAEQAISNTGGSTQSAAFNAKTRFVRIHTDTVCAVEFGTNPTAVPAGASGTGRMAAGQTEYRGVPAGQGFKVAVCSSS